MGFLDRQNPRATPRTARWWALAGAVGGGLVGVLIWLVCWSRGEMPLAAVCFFGPWMAIVGAVAGWAIEWQVPEDCETDPDPDDMAER